MARVSPRLGLALVAVFAVAACSDGETTALRAGEAWPATTRQAARSSADEPPGPIPACDTLEPRVPPGEVEGPRDPDTKIAAAQQWRADEGLRSDAEWVRHVAAHPGAVPEARAFEHPLTDEELWHLVDIEPDDHMIRRDRIVNDYVDEHADTFAGMLFDSAARRVVVLAFSSDVSEHKGELARRLGSLRGVRVVPPRPPAPSLAGVQDRITNTFMSVDAPAGAAYVSGVGKSPDVDRIAVLISKRDLRLEQAIADAVSPDVVCLEIGVFRFD